jgi:hypothetical protein
MILKWARPLDLNTTFVIRASDLRRPYLLKLPSGEYGECSYLQLLRTVDSAEVHVVRHDVGWGTLSVWASERDFEQLYLNLPVSWAPVYR